ncbi:MAG: FAD/NAD(P)-binding protein, partial [Gluconacetobacter diazotrophicus]|nr:FAD/NAD(P)-binding protein [Gluconacetobacter diazotrophicus]
MTGRIVVIGGGFTGAVVATRLLRGARGAVEVSVAEPRAR